MSEEKKLESLEQALEASEARCEAAQQLLREKQEEIEYLNRGVNLAVHAMIFSGLSVEKALEKVKSVDRFLNHPLRLSDYMHAKKSQVED